MTVVELEEWAAEENPKKKSAAILENFAPTYSPRARYCERRARDAGHESARSRVMEMPVFVTGGHL